MKNKYKLAFMDMAERFGQTSTAERLKVGCLLVKNGGIISEGVNGMPPDWPTEVCEDIAYASSDIGMWLEAEEIEDQYPFKNGKGIYQLITKPECRHSEIAALEKMWNKHETTEGAEAYISHSPCLNCSIKLFTAGIQKVYYRHKYRSDEGIEYLKANGVEIEQIE